MVTQNYNTSAEKADRRIMILRHPELYRFYLRKKGKEVMPGDISYVCPRLCVSALGGCGQLNLR